MGNGDRERRRRLIGEIGLLAMVIRCAPAASPSPSSVSTRPSAPAPPALESLEQAEPALLELEDRRAFDASVLDAAAGSANAAVRVRAALAVGRIGDERGAPLLVRLLSDASPEVRASSAFACGLLGEGSVTRELIPLLADPESTVVVRAAWSLGFLERPEAEDVLIAAIRGAASPEIRSALLFALWRFSTEKSAAAAAAYAHDPDGRIRAAAIYVLARRPREESLGLLTGALSDPDADSAALAARALGLLGHAESLPALLGAADGPRAGVVSAALTAAAAILEKAAGGALPAERSARVLALSSDANPNVAIPALALLRWAASDREAFRRLWTVASSGEGRRREVALQSATAALREAASPLLDLAIDSSDRFLRAAAAESLSFLPEEEAAPRRDRLASDPEPVVRLRLLDGLRSETAARAARALIEAGLADPDAGIRAAAIEALARLGDPSTNERLRDLVARSYADREPDVPIAALDQAVARPDAPGAREIAEAVYRHPATLPSRLGRRALVRTFHADPAQYPWREYVTGRSRPDYEAALAAARHPRVATVTTSRGTFAFRLNGAEAPLTVANFVRLAERGYFDGVRVHRVVPRFVLQDGDPTGTGNGGPGYEIRDEISPLSYETGTVGMALSGPDTGGSQWFVTHAPEPHLDGIYTIFGRVVSGLDLVRRVEQGDTIVRVTVARAGD